MSDLLHFDTSHGLLPQVPALQGTTNPLYATDVRHKLDGTAL